jgi:Zinc finger, C2H2 type/Zinc-finger of C2H2 type
MSFDLSAVEFDNFDDVTDTDLMNTSGDTTLSQSEVLLAQDLSCLDDIIRDIDSDVFFEIDNIERYLLGDDGFDVFEDIASPKKNPNRRDREVVRLDSCHCTICDKKFPSLAYLTRHYETKGHLRKKARLDFDNIIVYEPEEVQEVQDEVVIEEIVVQDHEYVEIEEVEGAVSLRDFFESYSPENVEEIEDVAPVPEPQPSCSSSSSSSGLISCTLCNKNFTKRGYLLQHNLTYHSGDKPFKCCRCGKRYANEDALNNHEVKHESAEKLFNCDTCSKGYINRIDLRRHEAVHTNAMPHQCHMCDKGFARRDHLEKHFLVHQKRENRARL